VTSHKASVLQEAAALPRELKEVGSQIATKTLVLLGTGASLVLFGVMALIVYFQGYKKAGIPAKEAAASQKGGNEDLDTDTRAAVGLPPAPGARAGQVIIPPGVPTTTMPAPYDPKPPPPTPEELGLHKTNPNNLIPQVPSFSPSGADGHPDGETPSPYMDSAYHPPQMHPQESLPDNYHHHAKHTGSAYNNHNVNQIYASEIAYQNSGVQNGHGFQNAQNVPPVLVAPPETITDGSDPLGIAMAQGVFHTPAFDPVLGPLAEEASNPDPGAPVNSTNLSSVVPSGYSSSPEINIQSMSDAPSPAGSVVEPLQSHPEPSGIPTKAPAAIRAPKEPRKLPHALAPRVHRVFCVRCSREQQHDERRACAAASADGLFDVRAFAECIGVECARQHEHSSASGWRPLLHTTRREPSDQQAEQQAGLRAAT
jgi:hypothetical protein